MKSLVLFKEENRQWIVIGRDPNKAEDIIDTNEYLVLHGEDALLLDPGGTRIFPKVLAELTKYISPRAIKTIALSHQDPDIGSSLALWYDLCPGVQVHCSWMWTGFIAHFGMGSNIKLHPIPDEGTVINFGSGSIQAVPAHFCHASGNFSFFDPQAKILFSGDIGAALLPDAKAELIVEDFSKHLQYMEAFHLRWMPSTSALRTWVRRVRELEPEMICPQHGAIFKGENVGKFLDWLETLDVGKWDG